MEDAHVYLFFLGSRNGSSFFQVLKLVIEVTQWEKALEVLSRLGEAAGGRTPPALIAITPYWADEEELRRLDNVAMEFYNNVFVMNYGRVGPYIVIFTYPSGTALPDRVTAEKVVRKFIELAGVCKAPWWSSSGVKYIGWVRSATTSRCSSPPWSASCSSPP
jgi:hypothetical protein